MIPTLSPGDIVIYRPTKTDSDSPKTGAIVVVKDPINPKQLLIKRIYKSYPFGLELRGDNESRSIDSRQFGLVHFKNLCGIVEEVIA